MTAITVLPPSSPRSARNLSLARAPRPRKARSINALRPRLKPCTSGAPAAHSRRPYSFNARNEKALLESRAVLWLSSRSCRHSRTRAPWQYRSLDRLAAGRLDQAAVTLLHGVEPRKRGPDENDGPDGISR